MKVHVAYVVHQGELGSKVLGVATSVEKGKELCKAHFEFHRDDSDHRTLRWDKYFGEDGDGIQSVIEGGDCYYVEETELELQTRGDDPETGLSWEARQVLNQMIANGRLAQQIIETRGMIDGLEDRVDLLSRYVDYLLEWLRNSGVEGLEVGKQYTFNLGGPTPEEVWDIKDWRIPEDLWKSDPGGRKEP